MLVLIATWLLANGDECNNACEAGIGAGGAVAAAAAAAAIALLGRRRMETEELEELANEGLCTAVNTMFSTELLSKFALQVIKSGENAPKMSDIAKDVASWCQTQAADTRRRLGSYDVESDFRVWTENFEKRARAEDMSQDLPAHMYMQCAGYATAIGKLVATGLEDGAIIFGASSKGSAKEMTHGCEAVVKNVNGALLAGDVPGLSVTEDDMGDKIVVATTDMGGLASAVTLATGGLVYKLMNLCKYYG